MMFAQQDLSTVPDSFWKNFCLALLVLIGLAVSAVGIWAAIRKPDPVKLNDNPAIEVRKAPKRYNHEEVQGRFVRIEGRLDDHDAYFESLREEDKAIREKNSEAFEKISRALGRIEGMLQTNREE